MAANAKVDSIIDSIRSRILSGEFGEEGRLPSFRKLVAEYDTSQETMNKAMQALQAEGILISAGAKGVFVNDSRIRIPGTVVDFSEYLRTLNFNPKSEFIGKPEVIEPSVSIAKAMKLKKGELVLVRKRKQGSDRAVFRLIETYFPMSLINDSIMENINKDPHFNIINAIKDHFGQSIRYTHEEIIARLPTAYEQNEMSIVRTNPVIDIELIRLAQDRKTIICYTHKVLNANLFQLTFDHTPTQWSE